MNLNTSTMTPAELTAAIDAIGRSKLDLASDLGVARRTLYNWLDGTSMVPGPAAGLIRLMAERAAAAQ